MKCLKTISNTFLIKFFEERLGQSDISTIGDGTILGAIKYLNSKNIDFVTFESANINVTLTASMKSLKEQAKNFIDKIVDDLNLIDTQEHKAEILVEYKQSLNVSQAITTVTNRFKAIEEENAKQERDTKLQKEIVEIAKDGDKYAEHVPTIEEVPQMKIDAPLTTPIAEAQEEILTLKFTVISSPG